MNEPSSDQRDHRLNDWWPVFAKGRTGTWVAGTIFVLVSAFGTMVSGLAATLSIDNVDAYGQGFNALDPPDEASRQGGNTGATLGEQRLYALQFALDYWTKQLGGDVAVVVKASMLPFDDCTSTEGSLARAGPTDYWFRNATQTWEPAALSNYRAGSDLTPGEPEILVEFNSEVGSLTCLSYTSWYYGLDQKPPDNTSDFYATALHEVAHGLGLLTFLDFETGEFLFDAPIVFDWLVADRGTIGKSLPEMTAGERLVAVVSDGDLVWTGANVTNKASSALTYGQHATTGEVLLYAPTEAASGSSVSHFDRSLWPHELMEPNDTPVYSDALTKALLQDIGWGMAPLVANLENPGPGAYKSGIGIVSGWICEAGTVVVEIDGTSVATAYGTDRPDTTSVCGDSNNGFGALYNWNRLGEGIHTAVAYADGVEFARSTFTVTTFGVEMLTGTQGAWVYNDFPNAGTATYFRWDEAVQNFVIFNPDNSGSGGYSADRSNLENPGPGAYKSGIGIVSGWICEAGTVVVEIDGTSVATAYGTDRPDTTSVCRDSNNGFGALYNWNRLGEGIHTAVAYADGVEFARSTFTVTTFGVEMLTGVTGHAAIPDFPNVGTATYFRWDEAVQNFVITPM